MEFLTYLTLLRSGIVHLGELGLHGDFLAGIGFE